MTNEDSIFSKIIKKEIPAKIRYEDDDFIVIDDINPIAPVHVLIITKKAYQTLEDIDLSDIDMHAKILLTARKVAKLLDIEKNYKLFMNVGKKVQQVHHVHLHLYGGWDNNKSAEQLDQESTELINS